MPDQAAIQSFIARWQASGAAERANFPQFIVELCDLLELPHPDPATPDDTRNAYVFERAVPLPEGSVGRIDLYKRGCFVLEAKQGSDQAATTSETFEPPRKGKKGTAVRGTASWDTAMERARQQAQSYARSLPPAEIAEGRPPFLLVVDVGYTIALYAEFTRSGGHYIPFPDPHTYRLSLADLQREEVRQMLRQVWLDPLSLDPARRSARVTREIAVRLAQLAKSLEGSYPAETVANFLMRCLFTMFAEDVGLLPAKSFAQILAETQANPTAFKPLLEELWRAMNTGGFSVALRAEILHFNGGLFAEPVALSLSAGQIGLLVEAAQSDWREVEPAIFGTLLERALDPIERHKLGAHYTPRAYVERLVQPAIVEPLRAEWAGVQAAAALRVEAGETAKAVAEVEAFQRRLATVKILDPACGSGNFLYVALEQLKRLEGEVLNTLKELGRSQMALEMEGVMVTPQQFLGLEVNPRAAAIAELVLWIGFLQWHFRTRGQVQPPTPIIKNYHNIEHRDAVLAWDGVEPLLDQEGRPVTRWDGRTTRPHPVTGQEVPDETARIPAYKYLNPRPAEWPEADFIVGNPPFIGTARMRDALGDGYTEALRRTYPTVPESCDYVMYWWDKAADLARAGKVERFGFITTNSLRQTFSRRVLQRHLISDNPLSLVFAIPDHPWVDSADGAAVRVSMTTAQPGQLSGLLQIVTDEKESGGDSFDLEFAKRIGQIQSDLTIGANVAGASILRANEDLSNRGMMLFGAGFIVTREEAQQLGLGRVAGLEQYIRQYLNGRDLTATPRNVMVIDLFGLGIDEVRQRFPETYQWVYERVKPERDLNNRKSRRENWWIFGEPNPKLRDQLMGLQRYIVTVETSKHRFFTFLDHSVLPDNKLINFAFDDAYFLGVLSSRIHVAWALAAGGHLGVGNDPVYIKTRCFETFPFPAPTEAQKERIRALAEQLDAHRKRQQSLHPGLTMTDMYNVLEKLRAGEALTAKEKTTHEQGLVSILKQLHDDLDAAVFDAYGWPPSLSNEEILEKLVALNAERAAEEARGVVRWLRPEYQAGAAGASVATQAALIEEEVQVETKVEEKKAWPASMAEQAQAVRQSLLAAGGPVTIKQVAAGFVKAPAARVEELLETMVVLGQARRLSKGQYVGQ
ncbi:MAG: class I SAM-dependent DNA methyltransferase [Anaerolineales bacterium]|nr:class I SAM-dependent DNA methyltransferase [Anaerolineales bacterium]